MASASAGLPSASPPPSRAATVIARASLVKCCPRRASTTAFLCLIWAHLEWPAMSLQFSSLLTVSLLDSGAVRLFPTSGGLPVLLRRLPLLAVLLVVIPLAAGCGSSKSSSSTPSPSPAPAPASGGGGGGGGVSISMKNTAFSPTSQTVKVGQKITWTNDDPFDHNVTATSGATFKSKNFGQGGTYTFTATKAGTIKYVCTIHPGMDGTLTVTK